MSRMKNTRTVVIAGLLLTFPVYALARGVSPYLPLNLAPEIERQIERVLILADVPVMTRPIAAATVLDALPRACAKDLALCKQVRRYLDRYMSKVAVTEASAEVAASNSHSIIVPNRHGMPSDSHWDVSAAALWQPSDHALISLGGVAYQGETKATGSMISLGWDFAQLDIGYRDHWYSPMTDSSMLISTEAPTMPSITLSNYQPIGSVGFRYEIFAAQMSHSDQIAFEGRFTSGYPRLAGLHLQIEPAQGWSLGANRLMQYGGGERDKTGLNNFFKALTNPSANDNTSSTLTTDQEFGNQQASWTSRFLYPGKVPFAVYFEYAGEDNSFSGNYRLGNAALSAGIHFPRLWRRFDVTYEVSNWQNSWYTHHIYLDGMTNDGRVLGHWGGDQRQFNDGVGALSQMVRVGWDAPFGGVLELQYRMLDNENYYGIDYKRAQELGLRYSRSLAGFTVGAEVQAGRDVFGDNYSRLAGFVRYSDEGVVLGDTLEEDSDSASAPGSAIFTDVGVAANKVRVNLGKGDAAPVYATSVQAEPHFGLGARRAVSDNSDLGVRLELDRADGATLIAVRALDYRYRFRNPLALDLFFGAARYSLATPAFGYYLGAGVEWRDLFPRWDLSLSYRYADKVARDKLLPQDNLQATDPRPDTFYDVYSTLLSLSYRW